MDSFSREDISRIQRLDSALCFSQDGYVNALNKYGTSQDHSTAWEWQSDAPVADIDLSRYYESNGIFSKIIDTPAEEAVKHGFELGISDKKISDYVMDWMEDLNWEEAFTTAIKWARLYGGSLIVMLADDGGGIEEPLNLEAVRDIGELRVFERAVVQPVEYAWKGGVAPDYYDVSSIYGSFRVHRSRCLVFKNGLLPETTTISTYRHWGLPEYLRIRKELRETVTSHSLGVKILERSTQAVYAMKGLAEKIMTDTGEDEVVRRLRIIDMARSIINSIAIDAEGEAYDFKSMSMAGVRDVIDTTCNMLSAVTNIPQTVLFGRSPAGQNATGTSDLENYYNYIERIQRLSVKGNIRTLVDIILRSGMSSGKITEMPGWRLTFSPLWSLSETEQAAMEQTRAATAQTKAATAQLYLDMQVLDAGEIRDGLAKSGEFDIETLLDEEDLEPCPQEKPLISESE